MPRLRTARNKGTFPATAYIDREGIGEFAVNVTVYHEPEEPACGMYPGCNAFYEIVDASTEGDVHDLRGKLVFKEGTPLKLSDEEEKTILSQVDRG